MSSRFSALHRQSLTTEATTATFDLLIIGGGITGAGIALDAVSRGMRVCLVEMQDFAAGTSNRSTKLVHGGLRYLKQFEVSLVAEVGKERAIVYENGPHITTPVWMLLPIYEGGTFGRFSTSIGLRVYDALARVKSTERRKMLSRTEALQTEPMLNQTGLKGAGRYVEYRTDDARLTLEVLKAAVNRGALAMNYTKVESLVYSEDTNKTVVGANVRDAVSLESFHILAKYVVNATGPWVDELRKEDGSLSGKTLRQTKGVHIVVDGIRFPLSFPVYFDVADGRMLFAIPREEKVYIGTTDTDYHADMRHPKMTVGDRDYLLAATNAMFPQVHLVPEDVESSWVGIRPLIQEEGKSPSEVSRKDEMLLSASGLITIAGGKLTGYRKMAQKVVDYVGKCLSEATGALLPKCQTATIALSGGEFSSSADYPVFVADQTRRGMALGLEAAEAHALARRYGTNVEKVFSYLPADSSAGTVPRWLEASIRYAIEEEMTLTPSDYWIRRTGALYFNITLLRRHAEGSIALMAAYLGWDNERTETMRKELADAVEVATQAYAME